MPKIAVAAPLDYQYTYDRFGMAETDSDNGDPGIEMRFKMNSSIGDGTAGRLRIDTTYENITEDYVDHPRSASPTLPVRGIEADHSGIDNPAPINVKRYKYPHREY